jgi:hypothetical protein
VCDNCVDIPNPNQEDADTNGIGDVCEEIPECLATEVLPPMVVLNNGSFTITCQ